MPWQNILMTMNTIDTFAGLLFLVGSWLGFRAWWKERQKGTDLFDGFAGVTGTEAVVTPEFLKEAYQWDEADHVGRNSPPCHEGCYICKVLREMKKDGDDD